MSDINYAILRTEKIKNFAALSAMTSHWLRAKSTPNADPKKTKFNKIIYGYKNPLTGVKKLLAKKGVNKLRKNGVIAIEFMLAFSPSYLYKKDSMNYLPDAKERLRSWIMASKKWLIEQYGENCISIIVHYDEQTPHIHAVICPMKQWVNKKGVNLNKLCARDITGGKSKLRAIQDSYANVMPNTLKRGIKGSKATHQTLKQYYTALNQSKLDCKKSGLIPPTNDPQHFNFWQQTVKKLTDSLEKDYSADIEQLNSMINNLIETNKILQEQLHNQTSKSTLNYRL